MNNIIQIRNQIFLLNTNHTSYMFQIGKYGHLEHLYYGRKVRIEDGEALQLKHDLSYGTTVIYNEEDQTYSLDHIPQEYGTYGNGDFKEASIEIEDNDTVSLHFLYDSYEIIDSDVVMSSLPSSYGAEKTLIIHTRDSVRKLELDLYYTVFPKEDVISRRVVLINKSDQKIFLHKMMSYCLDLCENNCTLMSFSGAWDKEMHLNEHDLVRGTHIIQSRVGTSSAKHHPGFIVKAHNATETDGRVWGFNLVYSGNHYSSIGKDEYGIHRIQGGINPERFCYPIEPQSFFESPEAILSFSEGGLRELSFHFHDFINEHIIRSDWKKKERPILLNSWEAFGPKFRKDSLLRLARQGKKLGIELFVLDDGWFSTRDDDAHGLGDFDCNLKKIPGGISALSAEIHKMGMQFGIWVEPEAVNLDSKLYQAHPEYVRKEEGREFIFSRHELLLDLTNPDVQKYIIENVCKLIDENHVDYIKWDMNRHANAVSGTYSHDYILALYKILKTIFYARPNVLLESCASGGNRFDLGMLCFSPQIWASDDTDPLERIDIQKGYSYLYPLSVIGAHVSASPHGQTLRSTPLETRFTVAAFGCLGYELDLSMLSPLEKDEIRSQIAYYKEHRSLFQYGHFYRIEEEKQYPAFEVAKDNTAVIAKFRRMVNAAPEYDRLFAEGLSEEKLYQIISRPYLHNIRQFGHLINFVSPIKISGHGHIMTAVAKRKGMNSADQNYTASGAALRGGIHLHSLFLGTGYNKNIRLPLDYGSDMYEIDEIEE